MDAFDQFWASYPRREAKKDAKKAWAQANGDTHIDAILAALAWQVDSDQWQRGYVPLAASYLRGERWYDERPETPQQRAARQALAAAEAEFHKWKSQGHPAYTPYATFSEFQNRRKERHG